MKKTFLILALIASQLTWAQSEKYFQTMGETIGQLYQAQSPTDFDPVINKLTRIAEAEQTQWEPQYYIALAHTFKSFRIQESDVKDASLDQALTALTAAEKVAPNNAEILSLQGFVNMFKISIDPGTRGQMLSGKAMNAFGRAMAIDPLNPRAALFMAQMQIGMAQFFGNSIQEPCALVQKSIALFEAFQPTNPLAPMWGKESVGEYVKMCGGTSDQ
jgi:hypothetical protein